jgi:carbon monoxide dehydrogenase subunit G
VRFEGGFHTPASAEAVYRRMLDISSAAACLPGASVGQCGDGGAHPATIALRVGPLRLSYGGSVTVTERDDARRAATMLAAGSEQHGQGAARAVIALRVDPRPDGGADTAIAIDLTVAGGAAQFGQGILEPVASSMIDRFAVCLAAQLSQAGTVPGGLPAADASADVPVSLLFRAVWTRIRHPHQHGGV